MVVALADLPAAAIEDVAILRGPSGGVWHTHMVEERPGSATNQVVDDGPGEGDQPKPCALHDLGGGVGWP